MPFTTVNNVNNNMYNPQDIFIGNYEVNFKVYDPIAREWSVLQTIGYTDTEVSLTPTTEYAEFNALVPQIPIANNLTKYMNELKFSVSEIMLDKLSMLMGGQNISTTSSTATYTETIIFPESDEENYFKVYQGDPENKKRMRLKGNVIISSIQIEQGILTSSSFTPDTSDPDISNQFTLDSINGEYYLTPINQTTLITLSGSNTHIRIQYQYKVADSKSFGLITDPQSLLRYFAFIIIGRNQNAGDGRWLTFFIPRAQVNTLPTLSFKPNEYGKYEFSFKTLGSIQAGVSPLETMAGLELVKLYEFPSSTTRSQIINSLSLLLTQI
jgi:hypothetical protein